LKASEDKIIKMFRMLLPVTAKAHCLTAAQRSISELSWQESGISLIHMVEDKARAQPVRIRPLPNSRLAKAQMGGQRPGEMEVWALN
jgi:hypothetical protein